MRKNSPQTLSLANVLTEKPTLPHNTWKQERKEVRRDGEKEKERETVRDRDRKETKG